MCDRTALAEHYRQALQALALPSLVNVESRTRDEVFRALQHATRSATRPYAKGAESFTLLARLDPQTLAQHLPSFARMRTILDQELR